MHPPNAMKVKAAAEEQAWEKLARSYPERVCSRTAATFDAPTRTYTVQSYGCDISVSPEDRRIFSGSAEGEELIAKIDPTFPLIWYLASLRSIPLTGRLVKPSSLPGGQIFEIGSHVLPLGELAERYARAPEEFIERGRAWGGRTLDHGDASLELWPFPRVPTTLILRTADEEFPASVNLLLDASCRFQLPTDIIWSTCMMSATILLA